MSSRIELDLGGLLSIGEKRKLLNKFISTTEEGQVNAILESCKNLPSTQYNLIKFLLAEKFHRFDLIIELLYDGDSSIISAAIAKPWLYEGENSAFTDSGFLINKLFPNVSYNCRQKVLHRIGRHIRNEEKADQIWNAVEAKYGFHVAFPLLQACTKDKINSFLTNRKVRLSGYQLVQLLQKYPDIGLEYLKNSPVKYSNMNPQCSPLHYVYNNRFDDFLDLCINHSNLVRNFKIGRSRSTKMIRVHRAKLLEHPTKTSSLLKLDRIQREFSAEEYQKLFESTLPKEPRNTDMDNDVRQWVNFLPSHKRFALVNQAYTNVYKINLDEHPKFMTADYVFMLPIDKRLSAIDWKIENQNYFWSLKGLSEYCCDLDETKRVWLPLKPISHSVPELKKLLLIEQNVVKRSFLSKYLIQTCYINEDRCELVKVLKLLTIRSRNDRCEVRMEIFRALAAVMKKMKFSKEHWDIIIEIIKVSLVFDINNRDFCYTEKEKLIDQCIAFRFENKLPLDDLVTMHIKFKIDCSTRIWINPHINNSTDQRTLLELYARELENLHSANTLTSYDEDTLEEDALTNIVINLIEEIRKFNVNEGSQLKPILISSHPWLQSNLERIVEKEENRIKEYLDNPISHFSWTFAEQLINIVQWLRNEQQLHLDAFKDFNDPEYLILKKLIVASVDDSVMYFLRKDPSQLVDKWPVTLLKILETRKLAALIKTLKHWNYTTLNVASISKCCEIITNHGQNTEVNVQQKCGAVLVLSVLKEPSDFLALVAEFYPTESKVDVFADMSGDDYQIRASFAKSLQNITVPHLTFEAIKKFCVGDYLKLSIGSLYSHVNRAPSFKSLAFLREQLISVPVSLQKHIIRLYCAIGSIDDQSCALKEINSSNVSIRYQVFLQANQLFRSSPSEATWTILKTVMESTSEDDASILEYLHSKPEMDNFPMEYIEDFIIGTFTLLKKLLPAKIDDFNLHLERIIEKIPEKTLDQIVMYDYDKTESFNRTFCAKYLQCSLSAAVLEHRLSNVLRILSNVIGRCWDKRDESMNCPIRSLVQIFISSLSIDTIRCSSKAWLNKQICQSLIAKFKALSTTTFFKEILQLDLALLLVAEVEFSGTERLRRFGRSLALYMDSLVQLCGGDMVFIAKDSVKRYVERSFSFELRENPDWIVEMVDGIIETSKTKQNQILAITFLGRVNPKEAHFVQMLEKINGVFNESNDIVIQTYYASLHR